MSITRRVFLRNGALALVGTSALPAFLSRAVMASETTPGSFKNKRLVVIFQRGAADGLNIVVPHADCLCGKKSIWRSFMPPVPRIQHARTLTLKTIWNRARRV